MIRPRKSPLAAAAEASFSFLAPRFLEILEFIPTPIPVEKAPIIICTGNASVTAASDPSLILATYMESTVLYIACISIAMIDGSAIFSRSCLTGSVAKFSCATCFLLLNRSIFRSSIFHAQHRYVVELLCILYKAIHSFLYILYRIYYLGVDITVQSL